MFININPEHAEEWADLFSARLRAFKECFEAVKKEFSDIPSSEIRRVTTELIYDANGALAQKHPEYTQIQTTITTETIAENIVDQS